MGKQPLSVCMTGMHDGLPRRMIGGKSGHLLPLHNMK